MVYVSKREPAERFWAKVNIVQDDTSCWEWTASCDPHGYGKFYVDKRRLHVRASRYSMELTTGHIPDGNVLHRCDNPPCVRPDHLWVGSRSENMRDAAAKGRLRVPPPMAGDKHPGRKINSGDVGRLKAMRADGATYAALASTFGISNSQAARICRGQSWWVVAPTGSGSADKDDMVAAAIARGCHDPRSHDEADAFLLRAMVASDDRYRTGSDGSE